MLNNLLTETDDRGLDFKRPHISFSQINRYLHCPEQYRLYYVEKLRPKIPSAALVFGKILHEVLAAFFRNGGDPVELFVNLWKQAGQVELNYGFKESWEKLDTIGRNLLGRFVENELPKIDAVKGIEKPFTLNVTSLDLPLIGIIDLVAKFEGKVTVVDFKSSASSYQEHEAVLSDQLTAYQLAEPEVEQTALCVFVKTKEPKIEWHRSERTVGQLVEFLGKAGYVAHEIASHRFYKRPGKWCSWCDYLPVCLKDEKTVKETLVQITH